MRVEEFETLKKKQLREKANECFNRIEGAGHEQTPALLLEAQFYLREIDRRGESWIAWRDLVLELVIIGLIGWEILEGNKQAEILRQMSASAEATATATKDVNASARDQATELKTLTKEETKSLDSLSEMNKGLHASLKQTIDMTVAMREQLKMLKEEQANRQAELAKKPKLEIYLGSILLTPTALLQATARQSTEDRSIYDVVLRNSGVATATKGTLRVILIGRGAWLESTAGAHRVYEQPDSEIHTFLIPFDYLRPNVQIPMSFTIGYPKREQMPIIVNFNVDVDELPVATPLGTLVIVPSPKSAS
jgi:hypothetical protein